MNSRLRTVIVVAVIATSTAVWYFLHAYSVNPSPGAGAREHPSQVNVPATFPTQAALPSGQRQDNTQTTPSPGSGPALAGQSVARPPDQQLSIAHRYESTTDKRVLFEELRASGNPEAPYFAAKILRDCISVGATGLDWMMRDFTAKIPDDSSTKAIQVEAFRRINQPCSGFDGRRISIEEVEQFYSEGVRRGDPRAIARALTLGPIDPQSDPIKLAVSLLEKNDPFVISDIAGFLGGPAGEGFVIDGKPVGPLHVAAAGVAWDLVACDFGGSCGPQSYQVLSGCAFDGVCGISSQDELARTFSLTPHEYEQALAFRSQIEAALRNKDFAALGLDPTRRPGPKG